MQLLLSILLENALIRAQKSLITLLASYDHQSERLLFQLTFDQPRVEH